MYLCRLFTAKHNYGCTLLLCLFSQQFQYFTFDFFTFSFLSLQEFNIIFPQLGSGDQRANFSFYNNSEIKSKNSN